MTKDFVKNIKQKIQKGELKMKPKIYFILGTWLLIIGLVFTSIASMFLSNLIFYRLRVHRPFGFLAFGGPGIGPFFRMFPWIFIVLTAAIIVTGLYLYKQTDISYKTSLKYVIPIFLAVIVLSGFAVDKIGLNEQIRKTRPFRPMYQDIKPRDFWITGTIKEIKEEKIIIDTPRQKNLEILLTQKTYLPPMDFIKENSCIKIIGTKISDNQIEATRIGLCKNMGPKRNPGPMK